MTPSVSVQTYLKLNLEDLVFFSDINLLILDAPQRLHNSTTISRVLNQLSWSNCLLSLSTSVICYLGIQNTSNFIFAWKQIFHMFLARSCKWFLLLPFLTINIQASLSVYNERQSESIHFVEIIISYPNKQNK